jgi:tetratricopeptide (TPR) repeat protein
MADVLRHRGWLALQQGHFGKALDSFGEASHIYRLVGARDGSAACLLATGHAHRALGQLTEAEKCFRTARDEYIALGSRRRSSAAHLGLVQLAIDSGHFDASVPHLNELLRELVVTSSQRSAMTTYVLLARCLGELGKWAEAAQNLAKGLQILGRLKIHDLDLARNIDRIIQLATNAGFTELAENARQAIRHMVERREPH